MPSRARARGGLVRFSHARDGDHLLTTFQCELCHFRNITGSDPETRNSKHRHLMDYLRRANLDAFWSRETTTVTSNRRELRLLERFGDEFRLDSVSPAMGPFPVKDVQGMGAAIMVLKRSQQTSGKYEKYVQPGTYRRTQAALTNVWRAGLAGGGEKIGAFERNKIWMSASATHTPWFDKFMCGLKRRTGEVVKQDRAISVEVLIEALAILEDRWRVVATTREKLGLSRMGAWMVIGFCTALRGEEMLLVERSGTLETLANLEPGRHPIPHFCVVVSGATKGNRLAGNKIKIPCAGITQTSGLRPGLWLKRYARDLEMNGERPGFLFATQEEPTPALAYFEDDFMSVLEEVQERRRDLISEKVDVREEYGIWRSLRRGVTAHAINVGVPDKLVELINRWRLESEGLGSKRSMIDVYSDYESLLPTTVKYSLHL